MLALSLSLVSPGVGFGFATSEHGKGYATEAVASFALGVGMILNTRYRHFPTRRMGSAAGAHSLRVQSKSSRWMPTRGNTAANKHVRDYEQGTQPTHAPDGAMRIGFHIGYHWGGASQCATRRSLSLFSLDDLRFHRTHSKLSLQKGVGELWRSFMEQS